MAPNRTRREVLRAIGVAGTALAVGPRVGGATLAEDRWICDTSVDGMSMAAMGDVEVVLDLRAAIDYAVVEGPESALPGESPVEFETLSFDPDAGGDRETFDQLRDVAERGERLPYAPDVRLELDDPELEADSGLNAAETAEDTLYDLQWDKQSQRIGDVHERATGAGARIGVIDDGVLGANPESDAAHPDLPNVRPDLSVNLTDDGEGPGPLNDDHGTHVAGTAAAAANGEGVVGVAPDAEVVDLRVFSGQFATTSSVVAAIVTGALPVDEGGAGCDVVNLSLGIPTLPVCSAVGLETLLALYPLYEAAAEFALANDCLPVASAGNSSTNLADPTAGGTCPDDFEVFGESGFYTLPASVDQFLTVGATGPVGFGWGEGNGRGPRRSETVAPGLTVESPVQTELPPEEPAYYSNYGGDGEVNVTAAGGNADLDAVGPGRNWFYDLVFNTGFVLDPEAPEDERLEAYTPSYVWKAGTSFSAPQVAGLAALLKGVAPDATATEVRSVIEDTAVQFPVGAAGQTTAPESFANVLGQSTGTNVGTDGVVGGDQPSNPGSNPRVLDSGEYRGAGHVDVAAAVEAITRR
jgi:hypothetical protein